MRQDNGRLLVSLLIIMLFLGLIVFIPNYYTCHRYGSYSHYEVHAYFPHTCLVVTSDGVYTPEQLTQPFSHD